MKERKLLRKRPSINGILSLVAIILLGVVCWHVLVPSSQSRIEINEDDAGGGMWSDYDDRLSCMVCRNTNDIEKCSKGLEKCDEGDQCYLEVRFDPSGGSIYNAGCRSDEVCKYMKNMETLGQSNKQDIADYTEAPICARCCATSDESSDEPVPCNTKLCNFDKQLNKKRKSI